MLYGEKIYLRELLKEDMDEIYNLSKNKEVSKYNGGWDDFVSKKYLEDNFKYFNKPSKKYFVIATKSNGIVGYTAYRKSNYCDDVYSISITIGKYYWNRGYGYDSLKTLLSYLFNKKKAHKVELEVIADNFKAIKLYEKLGFINEGIRRKKYFYENKYLDTVLMGILYDEYKNIRS